MQQFQEGVVFAGRYRIVRCIAAGGMGAVYEVVHLETERRRALKVMLPHILQSAELRERFKREARIAAHVESEFIVDVSDAGVDEATQMPFLVMELLRGEELGDRLKRLGRLPPEEVVTYLRQLALALDKTHQASIVHRDLKPENLFLTRNEEGLPRIKILDFGIAKLVAESSTNANATRSLGTPLYMSPEQFLTRPITGAADIYALGLLTYTFLVGAPYWEAEARSESGAVAFGMIAVHGPREPASVRAARRGATLPAAFDTWFAKATAVSPVDRFPTAISAIRALSEALNVALVATIAPLADEAPGPLLERPPSNPDDDSATSTLLLAPRAEAARPEAAISRPAGPLPNVEQSASMNALGTTVTRPAPRRGGVGAAIVVVVVASLGAAGILTVVRHRSPAESSAAPTAVAPPSSSSLPVPSASAMDAAEPPAHLAEPASPSAAPATSGSVAASPSADPTSVAPAAAPDAGARSIPKTRPKPTSDFNND
jgi:serine/threonine-protein kinase